MTDIDKLKHMLLAMSMYEEEAFEYEIQAIAESIKYGKPYDMDPNLEKADLIETVNTLMETLDGGHLEERTLRVTIRRILLDELG